MILDVPPKKGNNLVCTRHRIQASASIRIPKFLINVLIDHLLIVKNGFRVVFFMLNQLAFNFSTIL